jgi:hypothetical protein
MKAALDANLGKSKCHHILSIVGLISLVLVELLTRLIYSDQASKQCGHLYLSIYTARRGGLAGKTKAIVRIYTQRGGSG